MEEQSSSQWAIVVKASVITLTILALILIASMQAQSVAGGVAVVTPTITPTHFYVYFPFVSSDCDRICSGRDCYCTLDQR